MRALDRALVVRMRAMWNTLPDRLRQS